MLLTVCNYVSCANEWAAKNWGFDRVKLGNMVDCKTTDIIIKTILFLLWNQNHQFEFDDNCELWLLSFIASFSNDDFLTLSDNIPTCRCTLESKFILGPDHLPSIINQQFADSKSLYLLGFWPQKPFRYRFRTFHLLSW